VHLLLSQTFNVAFVQFFYDVHELSKWMTADMKKADGLINPTSDGSSALGQTAQLLSDMKVNLSAGFCNPQLSKVHEFNIAHTNAHRRTQISFSCRLSMDLMIKLQT
jgi:hypothetical protein